MQNPSHSNFLKDKLGGRNLYLVGMMGCGKSRTGPLLAKSLGYGFVDSDSVIENLTKKHISQIFEDEGEEAFRTIEAQVLSSIGEHHSLIVATGGGVVTRSQNWGVLHQGIVIWLNVDKEHLLARLSEKTDNAKRPLLQGNSLFKQVDSLLSERQPLYNEADLHIPIFSESPDTVAEMICEALPSIIHNPEGQDAPQTIEG